MQKRIFPVAILFTLLLGMHLQVGAQVRGASTVVKVNPLSLFVATLNVKVERRLTSRFSAQLGLHIGGPRLKYKADSLPHGIQYFMAGITPEFRYYIAFNRVPNPKGMYIGSFCKYLYARERYASFLQDPDAPSPVTGVAVLKQNVIALGFLVGYQWIFKQGISLDLYIGPQYSTSFTRRSVICSVCDGNERPIGHPGLRFDGIGPRAGLTLGYAF